MYTKPNTSIQMNIRTILLVAFTILSTGIKAQSDASDAGSNTKPEHPTYDGKIGMEYGSVVTLDFAKGTMSPSTLPFDVPFTLTGQVPKDVIQISISFVEIKSTEKYNYETEGCQCEDYHTTTVKAKSNVKKDSSKNRCFACDRKLNNCIKLCPWTQTSLSKSNEDSVWFYIDMPPLKANTHYKFFFSFSRRLDATEKNKIVNDSRLIIHRNLSPIFSNSLVTPGKVYSDKLEKSENEINQYFNRSRAHTLRNNDTLVAKGTLSGCLDTILLRSLYQERLSFHSAYMNSIPANSKKLKNIYSIVVDSVYNKPKFATILTEADRKLLQNLRLFKDNITSRDAVGEQIYRGETTLFSNKSPLSKLQLHIEDTNLYAYYFSNIDSSIAQLYNVLNMYETTFRSKAMKDKLKIPNLDLMIDGMVGSIREVISDLESSKTYLTWLRGSLLKIYAAINIEGCADFEYNVSIPFSGGSFGDFYTRSEWYLTFDAGLAGTWDAHYGGSNNSFGIVPYYALNLNLLPINRQVHYSFFHGLNKRSTYSCLKGISAIVGLTAISFNDTKLRRTNLFGGLNNSLLTGVGIRMNDYLRLSGGAIWGRREVDILNTETYVRAYPFISISVDLDIYKYYQDVRNEFFTKSNPKT